MIWNMLVILKACRWWLTMKKVVTVLYHQQSIFHLQCYSRVIWFRLYFIISFLICIHSLDNFIQRQNLTYKKIICTTDKHELLLCLTSCWQIFNFILKMLSSVPSVRLLSSWNSDTWNILNLFFFFFYSSHTAFVTVLEFTV